MNKILQRILTVAGVAAVPALINNAIFSRAKALGNTLGGEGRFWSWREGDFFYAHEGDADSEEPIVLLHGLYAGASSYEWRKNFKELAKTREVIALDWLGFGLSDKPKIRYSDTLYIDALGDFLRDVVQRPCTLVASSLAGAYAIEAALDFPDLVKNLVLVCPDGVRDLTSVERSAAQDAKYAVITAPLLGVSFYNAVTCPASLRAYLGSQIYFDPSYVTEEMVEQYFTASHQYGAQYAPLSFIAGELGHTVTDTLPKLPQQTIRVVWGKQAKMTPVGDAKLFRHLNRRIEVTVMDKSGLLPHDEQAGEFNALVEQIASGAASSGETTAVDVKAQLSKPTGSSSKTSTEPTPDPGTPTDLTTGTEED